MNECSVDGEEDDEDSDEELQKPVPPEKLQKLEEIGRIISAKYGSPYQPSIESTLYGAQTSQYSLLTLSNTKIMK